MTCFNDVEHFLFGGTVKSRSDEETIIYVDTFSQEVLASIGAGDGKNAYAEMRIAPISIDVGKRVEVIVKELR